MQSCDFSGSLQICFPVGQSLKSCSWTLEPKCEVKIASKHKFNQVSELKQNQTKKQNIFSLQSFKTKKGQQSQEHKDLALLFKNPSTKVKVESGLGVTAEVLVLKPAHIWLMDAWCTRQDFLSSFTVQPWKQIKFKKINQHQNKPND